MRRAISPAICAQVISMPPAVLIHRALRSLARDALDSAALETAGMIPGVLHLPVHRAAVGMHVEHVHEDADLQGTALKVGSSAASTVTTAIRSRKHHVRIPGPGPGRVPEKLQNEYGGAPERQGPSPADQPPRHERRCRDDGQMRPAFPGDEGVGIPGVIHTQAAESGRASEDGARCEESRTPQLPRKVMRMSEIPSNNAMSSATC